MHRILRNPSAATLATAIEDNMIEQFSRVFAGLRQVEMHREPDLVWSSSDIPHPHFNCVFRARFAPHEAVEKIEATLRTFSLRRLPVAWWLGPSTQPSDLGRHLAALGLVRRKDEIGMAVELRALKEDLPWPRDLVVEPVLDAQSLQRWVHLVALGFDYGDRVVKTLFEAYCQAGLGDHLPWRLYVGLLQGDAVAASRLFLGAGVAGVYSVTTVPEARRRGIGTAMTLAPLREARRMGCQYGVLRAAQAGLGVYRRLGFVECCRFGSYVHTPQPQEGGQPSRRQ